MKEFNDFMDKVDTDRNGAMSLAEFETVRGAWEAKWSTLKGWQRDNCNYGKLLLYTDKAEKDFWKFEVYDIQQDDTGEFIGPMLPLTTEERDEIIDKLQADCLANHDRSGKQSLFGGSFPQESEGCVVTIDDHDLTSGTIRYTTTERQWTGQYTDYINNPVNNGNGYIEHDELKSFIGRYDSNEDGELSSMELLQMPREVLASLADKNGDEPAAHYNSVGQGYQWGKRFPGGCFLSFEEITQKGGLLFNNDPVGGGADSKSKTASKVCECETTTTTQPPPPEREPLTEHTCLRAAIYRWGTIVVETNPVLKIVDVGDLPPGCTVRGSNGIDPWEVQWNRNVAAESYDKTVNDAHSEVKRMPLYRTTFGRHTLTEGAAKGKWINGWSADKGSCRAAAYFYHGDKALEKQVHELDVDYMPEGCSINPDSKAVYFNNCWLNCDGSQYTQTHFTTIAPLPSNLKPLSYGKKGENECPRGCTAVSGRDQCKEKGTMARLLAMDPAEGPRPSEAKLSNEADWGVTRPGGCFFHDPKKEVDFNTHTLGGGNGQDYKICDCTPPSANNAADLTSFLSNPKRPGVIAFACVGWTNIVNTLKILFSASKKNKIDISFIICWGGPRGGSSEYYGTTVSIMAAVPGWFAAGTIYWDKPTLCNFAHCTAKPFDMNDNPIEGKLTICKDFTFAEGDNLRQGKEGPKAWGMGVNFMFRLCVVFGFEPGDNGINLYVELFAGVQFGFTLHMAWHQKTFAGTGGILGNLRMRNFRLTGDSISSGYKYDGLTFLLSAVGEIAVDAITVGELTFDIDQEMQIYNLKVANELNLPDGSDCTDWSPHEHGACPPSITGYCSSGANNVCKSGMCGYHPDFGVFKPRRRRGMRPWQCCTRWGNWPYGSWCY
jgi:hypothetical protein